MMSFTSYYIKPGIYIKVQNVPAPNVSPGLFIPIFVGLGRKDFDVQTGVVRSAAAYDVLTDEKEVFKILAIIDQNGIQYINGTDYQLTESAGEFRVDWSVKATLTGTVAETFAIVLSTNDTLKINIDGTEKTVTLSVGATQTAANIVSDINTAFAPATPASDAGGYVKLTGDIIEVKQANANTTIGFPADYKIATKEPLLNEAYTVTYSISKETADYKLKLFSRLEDVYAEYGTPEEATELESGIATGGTNSTIVDTAATFITDGIVPGNYVKITSGTGAGQIRIVKEVTAEDTLTVYPNWGTNPDATSVYSITDIADNTISIACNIANTHGAQVFMCSQSPNDIVDDDNFRAAINATEDKVDGFQGWNLVYLKGVDKNDGIVAYIENYLTKMNEPLQQQERMALLGVKASTTNYTDVVQLTSGIKNARVGVVANPWATFNGMTLDGSFLAAAISGIICNPNYDSGEPISGKTLLFDYIEDPYTDFEKRVLGANGSIIIELQGTENKIIHYLSTKTDDIIDSELKVIKQTDDIQKTVRDQLSVALVNVRNSGKVVESMAASFIQMIMATKVDLTSIEDWNADSLEVKRNPAEPRELQIQFEYKPMFDVNWITVKFGATINI